MVRLGLGLITSSVVLVTFVACGSNDSEPSRPGPDGGGGGSVDGGGAGPSDGAASGATDGAPLSDGSATDGGDGGGSSSFTPAYPGQPRPGTLYWGAAVAANGDPVPRHETPSGHPLAVRRTFFQWSQRTTGLVSTAKDDLAHDRLPWVSVKPPSWAEMGAGSHDAEIDAMIDALGALSGPVWLTVHHEPEGGGGSNTPDDPAGPSGHLAMNTRVRQRIDARGAKNIALAPILMSWTWVAASGRDPEAWWGNGVYHFVGIDHYRDDQKSLLGTDWTTIRTWAKGKGVDVAVGEWGMRGTDATASQRVHEWYDAAAGSSADGTGARVVGLSAFDSGENAPSGSWELKGEQLTAFQLLLADPRTAHVK